MEQAFRPMTEYERSIFDTLLEPDFKGKSEIILQLKNSMVRVSDDEGSIEVQVMIDVISPVECLMPVEAEAFDEDGYVIYYILEMWDGKVVALERYKEGPLPIYKNPAPSELKVFVNK